MWSYRKNSFVVFYQKVSFNLSSHLVVVVVFSRSVVSDSLWPYGLQHARLPSSLLSPSVCSNSCPLSLWHCLTISSSAAHLSFCLQSLPASGSFPVSRHFPSSVQSTGASVSISVLPMNIQGWFSLGLTGLISLQSKGLSRVFSSTTNSLVFSLLYGPALTSIHDYWKNHYHCFD